MAPSYVDRGINILYEKPCVDHSYIFNELQIGFFLKDI